MRNPFSVVVYSNDEENAPRQMTKQVRQLVRIAVKNNQLFHSLESIVNYNGVVFRRSKYEIAMIPTGTTMSWRVFADDGMVGEQSIEIE